MSYETVEVKKEVELAIQANYVKCEECGSYLGSTLNSDSSGDLQITAERCTCKDCGDE